MESLQGDDLVDITYLITRCSAALTVADPLLRSVDAFELQDSMAASHLLDPQMDACEIPGSAYENTEKKVLFPRPAPDSLHDPFCPVPWDGLSLQDVALVSVQLLVRLQSFLGGAAAAESTFTCMYAHAMVLADMENEGESGNWTTPQQVLFAVTLASVEITDVVRSTIVNADIYEEEDFVVNTHGLVFYSELHNKGTVLKTLKTAREKLELDERKQSREADILLQIVDFQSAFLDVCSKMAKLQSENVRGTVEELRQTSRFAEEQLEKLQPLVKCLMNDCNNCEHTSQLLRMSFDSFVNRPLVGNAPVRQISFISPEESLPLLLKVTKEFSSAFCELLLNGTSLGIVQRMLDRILHADVNILVRSLIVLNLFFDGKLLGQHSLQELILEHIGQWTNVPDTFVTNDHVKNFLNRLAKPVYDGLKLRVLNRNRQRTFLEASILPDWSTLQGEAQLVDSHYIQQNGANIESTPPIYTQYVLSYVLRYMDRYITAGIEMGLFYHPTDLTFAYWYRDFVLSALVSHLSSMRSTKQLASRALLNRNKKKKKSQKKHQASPTNSNSSAKTREDLDDDFEIACISIERNLCRGILRYLAALRKAGVIKKEQFEFTDMKRVFEKRFDIFHLVRHPPPLSYEHFEQGTDHTQVSADDIMKTATDFFRSCKENAEMLLLEPVAAKLDDLQVTLGQVEAKALVKVCVGNAVYLMKLRQFLSNEEKMNAEAFFDFEAHPHFCTIKLETSSSRAMRI